jgi:DNA invertase Pin-like site-specific DNA recombinase
MIDMKISIGYVRTSLDSEHEKNQIQELIKVGISKSNIFVDKGVSGSIAPHERKGYKKMLDFIKKNASEDLYLYVYEISRISRDLTDFLNAIRDLETLTNDKICIKSLSPRESFLDCDPAIRSLVISVMAWCAERERDLLIERTKVGIARAKAEGKHCGRPYKDIDMKRVEKLHSQGMNYREISDALKIPYATLMRRKTSSM